MGFADTFRELGLPAPPDVALFPAEALAKTSGLTFGRTDCALPMRWAQDKQRDFDAFVIITDNETWCGAMHPIEALRAYRQSRVASAHQVVLATTAMHGSIADPAGPIGARRIGVFGRCAAGDYATFLWRSLARARGLRGIVLGRLMPAQPIGIEQR